MPSLILHDQAKQYAKSRPDVAPGFTVRIHERIREGEKERVQIYEGLIISVHRGHTATDVTITVRKIASGIGVERIFPLHSAVIEKIEVKKVAKVRRANLSFLRGRKGKAARMNERFTTSDEFAVAVAAPAKEEANVEVPLAEAQEAPVAETAKEEKKD